MRNNSERGFSRAYLLTIVGVAALAVISFVVSVVMRPTEAQTPDLAADSATQTSAPASTTAPTPSPTPSPTPEPAPRVTFAFAGDIHFAGRTEGLLADPATALGPISETLSAADIAMVNLESAITERGVEEPKQFHFRAPPSAFQALAAAGVDVVTMANNHAVDYGPVGLEDTLAAVAAGPMPVVGIGPDAATAFAPYRTQVRGVAISIFGVSQVPDRTFQRWTATDTSPGIASTADRERLLAGVAQSSAAGDVVIVFLHWGVEGDSCPTPEMTDLAADLAAVGADAIVGSHAHLLLGAGYLNQPGSTAYVAYGLGNFLWWRPQAFSDDTGVLTLTVQNGAVTASTFTPAVIDDAGRPQPLDGLQAPERVSAFNQLRGCADLRPTPVV